MQGFVTIKKIEVNAEGWTAVYMGKVREWKVKYLNGPKLLYIYKADGVTVDHNVECTVDSVSTLGIIQHLDDEDVKNIGWITADELAERDNELLAKLKKAWYKVSGHLADTGNEDILQMKYVASTTLQEIIDTLNP